MSFIIFVIFDKQRCSIIPCKMVQMFDTIIKTSALQAPMTAYQSKIENVLYQSQSAHYHLLHGRGKTFTPVMVNTHFSECSRNSTLMSGGNSAACQNKSPPWPSPGPVCPGGRLFGRITLTVTARLRWSGDERGSLSGRNHSLAVRAMGPTFNFKPGRSRSSHGPCTQRLFFRRRGEECWVFNWSLLLTFSEELISITAYSIFRLTGDLQAKVSQHIDAVYRYANKQNDRNDPLHWPAVLEVVRLLFTSLQKALILSTMCEARGTQHPVFTEKAAQ